MPSSLQRKRVELGGIWHTVTYTFHGVAGEITFHDVQVGNQSVMAFYHSLFIQVGPDQMSPVLSMLADKLESTDIH